MNTMHTHGSIVTTTCDRRRCGLATVEAALVFPFLLAMLTCLICYGYLFYKSQQLSGAARDGARVASCEAGTSASVVQVVEDRMTGFGFASGCYTLDVTPAEPGDCVPGDVISVSVEVPVPWAGSWSLPGVLAAMMPDRLHRTVTMVREGNPFSVP
jgi:hypothetical protein